jgi:RNA polymerase subunit RPABC4/transcription elongation factor Spt4
LPATPPKPATPGVAASSCAFCSQVLPVGRTVRFCPHCGGDQSSRPCPSCGEVLEREWRYCIACGSAA